MSETGNLRGIKIHPTLAKEYVAAKATTRLKSPVTRKTAMSALHCLQRRIGDKRVNEITLDDLIEFVTRDDHGRVRAGATQKNLQSRLVQVLKVGGVQALLHGRPVDWARAGAQPGHLPHPARRVAVEASDR